MRLPRRFFCDDCFMPSPPPWPTKRWTRSKSPEALDNASPISSTLCGVPVKTMARELLWASLARWKWSTRSSRNFVVFGCSPDDLMLSERLGTVENQLGVATPYHRAGHFQIVTI